MDEMLHAARRFHEQFERVLSHPNLKLPKVDPDRILILGTGGGSAMAGEILRRLLDRPGMVSAEVSGEYRAPAWVSRRTLVFAASHSGNTKETLSSVKEATSRGARICALTAGGRLGELAREKSWPVWPLTPGIMPRALLGEILGAMIRVLGAYGLYPGAHKELEEACQFLRKGILHREKEGLGIAKRLQGFIPYIFGSEPVGAVCGMRLKNQLAENGKLLSFLTTLPRAHHDDIVGWSQPAEVSKRFAVLFLRDTGENGEIQQRFRATKDLLAQKAGAMLEISSQGKGLISRVLTLVQVCDFVSIYAALQKGVQPNPVPLIDELKRIMGQSSLQEESRISQPHGKSPGLQSLQSRGAVPERGQSGLKDNSRPAVHERGQGGVPVVPGEERRER